ncbi:putative sporulation protein YtxC [Salinibacillus kushneri]|uniref:Putative sporulation protein YtxC n=1 Tax=Salinibacillus kushneri TaxID=237682 RepID=A0A1I0H5K4_9BACI|nr:sporulation protein YtxC [Salinibacillus kushneri]SET78825.1 putative sporulation protein YtxC [Salinibacillus kushneri]
MGLVIHFFSEEEAEAYFHRIYSDDEHRIQFERGEGPAYFVRVDGQFEKPMLEKVIYGLLYVFIQYRLPALSKDILKKVYYFSDEHELMHIIPILQSVMQNPKGYGTQSELQSAMEFYYIFEQQIGQNQIVSFDVMMENNQQYFKEQLIEVTGYAIEEWKREEDYQDFIQRLRDYLKDKEPKTKLLVITYHHEFHFFKEDGRRYTTNELKALQNKESLHFIDLLSSEFPLPSILGVAPKRVVVYTSRPSDPKIIFLQSIFQEHVKVLSMEKFPFIGKKA